MEAKKKKKIVIDYKNAIMDKESNVKMLNY